MGPCQYSFAIPIGALHCLVDSIRPDLAFIAGLLAQLMARPTKRYWAAKNAVAQYLVGTKDFSIL